MRAYAELVHAVRESLDEFAEDQARCAKARASLARRFPELVDVDTPAAAGRGEPARLLVMGINRIVVTSAHIKP